jgi:hypothetical protein
VRVARPTVGGGVSDMSLKTKHDDRLKIRAHPAHGPDPFGWRRRRVSTVHDSRGYDASKVVHKVHAKRVYHKAG